MTAPASAPDGTDPRILSPGDDDPDVTIASGHSTGKTYHTMDCPVVKRMKEPKTTSRAVAEWKGYSKCERCDELESGQESQTNADAPPQVPVCPACGTDLTGVKLAAHLPCDAVNGKMSADLCEQLRRDLLAADSLPAVVDKYPVEDGACRRHARGDCDCRGDVPPLTYDMSAKTWVSTDKPTPTERKCRAARELLVANVAPYREVAARVGMHPDTTRKHVNGACECPTVTPPLAFDHDAERWRYASEVPADARRDSNTTITSDDCRTIRSQLAAHPVTAHELAADFRFGEDALRTHATGRCSHDHDTPPVTYRAGRGWQPVTPTPDATRDRGVGDD